MNLGETTYTNGDLTGQCVAAIIAQEAISGAILMGDIFLKASLILTRVCSSKLQQQLTLHRPSVYCTECLLCVQWRQ